MESNNPSPLSESQELADFRQIILGKNNQRIRDVVEEDARKIVSKVLTEALHDRQNTDGTVSQVLAPLIEKAVEKSVLEKKDLFIGYLYPLVGGLIRKAVSAFITGFMEQTNLLLESSFTIKGLQWRFRAWRTGVPYAQYVIRQTFVFRVEQILLIHNETSMLLNTVVRDKTQATDGDTVSAMLSAINDFVSDSFYSANKDNKQFLDEIKTDDFTLLIKQGPQAMLVAAITGNYPAAIGESLQLSLETIHKIYGAELDQFDGDALPFVNTEQQLNDCLLAQQKESITLKKKKPWMAIALFMAFFFVIGYFTLLQWQLNSKIQRINSLVNTPGIVLLNVDACNNKICIELLRDPLAQPAAKWIEHAKLAGTEINIMERPYRSLDPVLIKESKVHKIKALPASPGIVLLDAELCDDKVCITILRDPLAEPALSWLKGTKLSATELVINERVYRSLDAQLTPLRLSLLAVQFPELTYINHVFSGQLSQEKFRQLKHLVAALPDEINLKSIISKVKVFPTLLPSKVKINRALLTQSINKLENTAIIFNQNESQLSGFSLNKLTLVSQNVFEILNLSEQLNSNIKILILGASSPKGSKVHNRQLSLARAQSVKTNLISNKVDAEVMEALGLGSLDKKDRRVMFSVVNISAAKTALDLEHTNQ